MTLQDFHFRVVEFFVQHPDDHEREIYIFGNEIRFVDDTQQHSEDLKHIARQMEVIAKYLNIPFNGTWYQCNDCLGQNLKPVCRGCGSENVTGIHVYNYKN